MDSRQLGVRMLHRYLTALLTLLGPPADPGVPKTSTSQGEAKPPPHAGAGPQDMVELPGGCFEFGCPDRRPECDATERPTKRVCLAPFRIDRTEVTVRAWRECVDAKACPRIEMDDTVVDLPIVGVTWSEAYGFCKWKGKRLPTEAEWEYAAGGSEGRIYPWGDFFDESLVSPCGERGLCAVCSRPGNRTPQGICDLAGNAFEWVADGYRDGHKGVSTKNPKGPCHDRPLCPGIRHKVIKGGAWNSATTLLRVTARYKAAPDQRLPFLGFRCASDLPQ